MVRHRHEHGDFIIVLNASKVEFTGRKWSRKIYYKHSGYPGGLKARNANDIERRNPGDVLRKAVVGMLPRNKLRDIFKKRLKIYAGEEHDYEDKLVGERAAMSPLDDIVSTELFVVHPVSTAILTLTRSRVIFVGARATNIRFHSA